MDLSTNKLTLAINANDRDRYCAAILALLKRVEVPNGDKIVMSELGPLYELLDLLTTQLAATKNSNE